MAKKSKKSQDEGDKREIDKTLKYSVYILGTLSLLASIASSIYEIHDKIFIQEELIPENSFVFSIACITFSLGLLAGCHKERLDYVTPYFVTDVIQTGYFVSVILLVISKWSIVKYPKGILIWSILGLILSTLSCAVLFKFMEKLKSKYGIRSTWQRIKAYTSGAESGEDTE